MMNYQNQLTIVNYMHSNQAKHNLKQIFNLDHFYGDQWAAIERLLNGGRVLLIEKTGFGKSLCYQFPATQFSGLTIVFSPLIALMRDQVKYLKSIGIPSACVNSEQEFRKNSEILEKARQGKIKILYIAPERQENQKWLEAVRRMKLSMVVIDEAHCVSVWGHDFRPAFRRIINLVKLLPSNFPVLATTATATERVANDIISQIGGNVTLIRGDLLRENFHLRVVRVDSEEAKMAWLAEFLKKQNGNGLIYTGTRVNTDLYASWLQFIGISAANYNAGLDADSRKEIEDGLLSNRWKCIVSTNALGMGIDKPDIRFIIHTQFPQSPIHYYQEIGRAGRDGLPTKIALLYNPDDKDLPEYFIKNSRPAIDRYYRVIDALKQEPLDKYNLMRSTNSTEKQVRVITADLLEQGIIREVMYDNNYKYEYQFDAPQLNSSHFEKLRRFKFAELEQMIEYAEMSTCRMDFLCSYLGDNSVGRCGKCDNDLHKIHKFSPTDYWINKINEFRDEHFPVLKVESGYSNIVNGVASGYYGFSNIGSTIHRCKYENGGDFPEHLLKQTLRAFNYKFGKDKFDLIVYVPPTESGGLVKNFAEKIAKILGIPFSNGLKKIAATKPQKVFQNYPLKLENVRGAFTYENSSEIIRKSILLIDDIFDSGATIKEIGATLTDLGAAKIAPVVIAKTISSSWDDTTQPAGWQEEEENVEKESLEIDVYEILRRWRWRKANELSVPAYYILSNEVLENIAATKPETFKDLLDVKGIGVVKLEKYGEEILKLINKDFDEKFEKISILPEEIDTTKKDGYDIDLYENLKQWLRGKAKELSLPSYCILSKATLKNIAALKPKTAIGLMGIKGIGEMKIEKYGEDILNLINKYSNTTSSTEESDETDKIAPYVKKDRKIYPNAYKPWTEEDDKKLWELHDEVKNIEHLSHVFKRTEGEIRLRINTLHRKYGN